MMIVSILWTILWITRMNAPSGKQTAMQVSRRELSEQARQRAQADHHELAERIARAVPTDGTIEPLDGVQLRRSSCSTEVGHTVSTPVVCFVGQGAKEIILGDKTYRYDPAHYLITTAELPVATRIVTASAREPYLGVVITLDPTLVSSVMVEAGHVPTRRHSASAIDVSPLDSGLLDAVVRLLRLLDTPAETRFLGPLIKREIIYRLLVGDQGARLRHVAVLGGTSHRIVEAIQRIRKGFDQPLRIEDLARDLGMSVSAFHAHFKAVTEMSPLEFQKQLRLQEARRLMLGEGLDAGSAGARVGYRDASQFTREYKRRFGAPPARDVARLRDAGSVPAGL